MHSWLHRVFSSALQGGKRHPSLKNGPFLPQINFLHNGSVSDCNVTVTEKQGVKHFRASDYHLHNIKKKNIHNY